MLLEATWNVPPFSLNSSFDVNGSTALGEHDGTLDFMLDAALPYEDEEDDDEEAYALDNIHIGEPDQKANERHVAVLEVLSNRIMSHGWDSLPGPALLSALVQISRCRCHSGALVSL